MKIRIAIAFFTVYEVQKKNFLKLKNLILIGGPDDGVITPWQSRYMFTIIMCLPIRST